MKKILATVLAAVCVLGTTGCAGGGKFKSTSSSIRKAAEKASDVSEASKKQKKAILGDDFGPNDELFNKGCFYTLETDEAENSTLGIKGVEEGDIKKAFVLVKSEEDAYYLAIVFEAADKDIASDIFDKMLEEFTFDEKDLKAAAKKSDLEYGIDDEDDNKYAALAISDNDSHMASGMYFKVDGKVLTVVTYTGAPDLDLYQEYLDVMFDSKLADMEGLL